MTLGREKGYRSTPAHPAETTFQRHRVPTALGAGARVLTAGSPGEEGMRGALYEPEPDAEGFLGVHGDYTPTHPICGLDLGLCKAGSSA